MNCIILGKGFIGSELYQQFVDNAFSTSCYGSADYNLCSLEHISSLNKKISHGDSIIFASAVTRLKDSGKQCLFDNILMATNFEKLISNKKLKQVIFFSTVDIYGLNAHLPISEESPINPSDAYAISKMTSEFILKKICSKRDIPLLILRLVGTYGRGDQGKSTINTLCQAAARGKINIFGSGSDLRDFVYVEDLYKICVLALENPLTNTLNVATGHSVSIKDIALYIKNQWPYDVCINKIESIAPSRSKDLVFNNKKLKTVFPGLKMKSIFQGLDEYIASCIKKEDTRI